MDNNAPVPIVNNDGESITVKNTNDPVRVINAVGAVASPLILAWIAATGTLSKPADPAAAPAVTIQSLDAKLTEQTAILKDIATKLTPVKK